MGRKRGVALSVGSALAGALILLLIQGLLGVFDSRPSEVRVTAPVIFHFPPVAVVPLTPVAVDAVDPDRSQKELFNSAFAGNPVYACADGRNAGLTYRDMDRFKPCVNGSLVLAIPKGGSGIALVTSTTQQVLVNANALIGSGPGQVSPGWQFRYYIARTPAPTLNDNGSMTQGPMYRMLGYDNSDKNVIPYHTYMSTNGGPWQLVVNLNDQPLDVNNSYTIVFTWLDASLPLVDGKGKPIDAPVPFRWEDVAKDPNYVR